MTPAYSFIQLMFAGLRDLVNDPVQPRWRLQNRKYNLNSEKDSHAIPKHIPVFSRSPEWMPHTVTHNNVNREYVHVSRAHRNLHCEVAGNKCRTYLMNWELKRKHNNHEKALLLLFPEYCSPYWTSGLRWCYTWSPIAPLCRASRKHWVGFRIILLAYIQLWWGAAILQLLASFSLQNQNHQSRVEKSPWLTAKQRLGEPNTSVQGKSV